MLAIVILSADKAVVKFCLRMNRVYKVNFIHSLRSIVASYLVRVKALPRWKVFEAIVAYGLRPYNRKCHLVIPICI